MPIVKICCSMCIKGCLNYPTLRSIYYPIFCTVWLQHKTMYEKNNYGTRDLKKREKLFPLRIHDWLPCTPSACQPPVSRAWRIGENGECLECFVSKIKCFIHGACLRGNFYNCVCLKLYVAKMGMICGKNGVDLKLFGSKMVCVFDCTGLEWCGSIISCLESCVAKMVCGKNGVGLKWGVS